MRRTHGLCTYTQAHTHTHAHKTRRTNQATVPSDRVTSKIYDLDGFKNLPADFELPPTKSFPKRAEDLPTDFDARTAWPSCPSIRRIRDQCGCGSCFAFGAIEAFEDRICIHSGRNVTLSTGDIVACHVDNNMSCQGGNPIAVWHNIFYGKKEGDGAIQESCYPYPVKPCPCNHHSVNSSLPHCPPESENTDPLCDAMAKNQCADQGVFRSTEPTLISDFNMEEEIVTNGPITAAFTVYDDFLTYSGGIYQHGEDAKALGGHAIRIVGYGVEDGHKYWTVANSWVRRDRALHSR